MPEIKAVGFRHRGNIGAVISVACGIWAIVLLFFMEHAPRTPISFVTTAIAWSLLLAGGGLRLWATMYLGGRKNDILVAEGPYSMCRNPLYLGTFFILLSAAFFLESVIFALGAVGIFLFYYFATIPSEEVHLRKQLGKPYEQYCNTVPRLFLNPSLFRTSGHVTVKMRALWLEVKRMGAWIWLPILADILHQVR